MIRKPTAGSGPGSLLASTGVRQESPAAPSKPCTCSICPLLTHCDAIIAPGTSISDASASALLWVPSGWKGRQDGRRREATGLCNPLELLMVTSGVKKLAFHEELDLLLSHGARAGLSGSAECLEIDG